MSPGWLPSVRISALSAALAIFALAGPSPSLGYAAPDDPGAVAAAPALPLTDLGADSTISLYGQQGTETLAIPVPLGLLPAELSAVVEIPGNLRSGMLTVTQDDRTISRVPLPGSDLAPIAIPLAGVNVVENSATIVLHS